MPPTRSTARGSPGRLAGWLEGETRIAIATRPVRESLTQREHYTDMRGEPHPLATMSSAEALLVLALLERHATTLHRGELGEYLLHRYPQRGQETFDEAHRQLACISAAEWLRRTPLHRALTERASQ